MPPVIVTADNIPDVLTQLAERQDEQAAAIELLAVQLADQSIRTEQQDKALRTQAAALRVTAAQLSRNIADTAKAANGSNGAGAGNGNPGRTAAGNGNSNGNGNGNGNPGRTAAGNGNGSNSSNTAASNRNSGNPGGIAGAGIGGEANLGPVEAEANVGGRIGNGQSRNSGTAVTAKRARHWL